MKNTATVIVLYFTFSAFLFAQKIEQESPSVLAKKELASLLKFVDLDNSVVININDLLIYKHETYNKYPERKEETAATIEAKLKGTLTSDQFLKIKNNKSLFNDLLY